MKKLILSVGLLMATFAGRAQMEPSAIIEKVIVEKFHVATATDEANGGPKAGSVTWRIYLDMIPDARFLFITGDRPEVERTLKFSTTTSFYNHANGDVLPNFSYADAIAGTVGYDSYLTAGAATSDNYFGVPKTISADGYALNTGSAFNTPAISPGVDFTPNFKNTSGTTFESAAVSVGPDLGQEGYDPTGQNILLLGQFTTDGEFCFNISTGVEDKDKHYELVIFGENYVYDGTEFFFDSLKQCAMDTPNDNVLPVATLTEPLSTATVCKDSILTISATATDADGTVKKVEFFANNVSIGVDSIAPYSLSYTPLATVSLALKVVATDNLDGMSKDSSIAHVTVDVTDCTITGISSLTASSPVVNLYPNPATYGKEVKIEIASLSGKQVTVDVTDLLGRALVSKKVSVVNNTAVTSLNGSDLSKGTYLVVIRTEANVITKKLIID